MKQDRRAFLSLASALGLGAFYAEWTVGLP